MRIALSLSLLLATACATSPGRLEPNRFQSELYPYSLFYAEAGSAEHPIGPDYKVENFESRDPNHHYAKLGPDFTVQRNYRDEQPAMVGREPFYDLLLTRAEPAARLWLRSVPLPKADADVALAELAQRYLQAVAQTIRVEVPFGVEDTPANSGAAATLRDVQVRACELTQREAVRLDFSVQNPASVHKLSEPEWYYGSVVLVRSGYVARNRYPVLLLAGKSSPSANPALDQDFDRMLDRLVLGDKFKGLSMKGGHSCGKHATAASAAEPPPADSSGGLRGPQLEVPIVQEDPAQPVP